jgi:hypothetical protein
MRRTSRKRRCDVLDHAPLEESQGQTVIRRPQKRGPASTQIRLFANRYRLNLRADADGTKIIPGKMGQIYEYDGDVLAVLVMPSPPRQRYWGCARLALQTSGLVVVQDGDGEGAATFDPFDSNQVKAAFQAAGLKRKRQLSPEQRKRRIAFLRRAQEGHLGV